MERNSGTDGLNYSAIFINGKPIRRSLIRKTWTKQAKECYERGCNCKGCKIVPSLETPAFKCRIKDYVMAYIKMGYYPKTEEDENENENDNDNN